MRSLFNQPGTPRRLPRYVGVEIRASEEQREQERRERLAELRRRFVDGPVLVIPGQGGTATFAGDGWTFKAASGWVVREAARRGDYEVVRQQP